MDKDHFNILIFGQKTSKTRHLRVHKKTFKVGLYLLAFALLSTIFFFCDYIQVRRKGFELSQLRQETQEQKSKIHFFSSKIEDLEKQLSKLSDFDKRIRIIANLEKGQETSSHLGMGGPSPSDVREKLRLEKDDKGLVRQMKIDVERLKAEATNQEESLSELEKLLQSKKEVLIHTPSVWPVMGWVTSGFGFRTNPFTGLTQMHEGLDISNRVGTPVIAVADGIVSDSGNDWAHGRIVVISHGFGLVTRYSHLSKVLVRVGQKVKRGDNIAEVGVTGKTTGPHLHYEIRLNGVPVNPMKYILN
ncbi:MAG TPA: peptidoglycan DD-metalloendopeptidase family protein [Thermodesulfobacteriota bacterium]|nr:peptidoglycan DD-metalloendopeptidase family protein [Thermodesulfobacteriota bacterium]